MSAEPLQALFHPFTTGALARPAAGASILLVNVAPCAGLALLRDCTIIAQHNLKPQATALAQAGCTVLPDIPDAPAFDLVLVHGAKQHLENRAQLAAALRATKPDARLVIAAANDAGGRRLEQDMADAGVAGAVMVKHKSRIVWTDRPQDADPVQQATALNAGDYQPILGGGYISRPGVFCWDRIDDGSALLADALPPLAGRGADFGCGYGFLSAHILGRDGNGVTGLTCIDVDARALESCRRTMALRGPRTPIEYVWADIPAPDENLPRNLDWIVMNPPFHAGKAALPAIGKAFIARAAASLRPGGILWLVANAGLPYEQALGDVFKSVTRLSEAGGYKLYRAQA